MKEPQLLITDDDRDFRTTLGEALERRGFRTVLAADGVEALEVVRSTNIHLVMMDVHMPRLDGLGMLASLRDSLPTLPCILMTAKLDDSIVTRAKQLQTELVMSKPFSLSLLFNNIRILLDQHYGGHGVGESAPI